jgi:dTDP-4-dehydrorhamnose reductase
MKEQIIVLGSKGQLGTEFKKLLGDKSIYISRDICDLTDFVKVRSLFKDLKPSLIINAAAYTFVDKAETSQDAAMKLNCELPALLADISTAKKCKLITYSTDYVFDGTSNIPLSETDATNPKNFYGFSKLEGEKKVLQINPESLIIRTSWVYSSHGINFLKKICELGKQKDELSIIYDQVGSLTWSRDLAEASLKSREISGLLHYSSEGVSSWYDVAVYLKKLINFKARLTPVLSHQFPTSAKRPHYSLMSKEKIKSITGIIIPHWTEQMDTFFKVGGF